MVELTLPQLGENSRIGIRPLAVLIVPSGFREYCLLKARREMEKESQ
jgi:hypothetical protein